MRKKDSKNHQNRQSGRQREYYTDMYDTYNDSYDDGYDQRYNDGFDDEYLDDYDEQYDTEMNNFHMNLDHSYDPEDAPEDNYDTFADGDGYDDMSYGHTRYMDSESPQNFIDDERSARGQRRNKHRQEKNEGDSRKKTSDMPAKKIKNRQIMSILYGFLVIFFGMIGYFIYYDVIKSDNVTNNPNNVRIAKLSDTVTRGKIVSSDGTVLAETLKDGNGEEYRYYPYENMFAHVVGVSKLNKSGIEATDEYYLLQSNINPIQKAVNEFKGNKSEGDNVVTTLDLGLQQVAYNALGNNQGVVIAMDPTTGKVLSMVSKPDYNPNTLAQNYDSIISDSDSKVLLNQATQGLFTPGSIFKVLTVTEYLREYPNASNYSYTCNGSISLSTGTGTASLSCYAGHMHGTQNLVSSFANSCNTSFANIGLNLSVSKFNETCNSMYFNTALPTDIPHTQSSFSLSADASQWKIGATAIGQGDTVMTPLHALILTSAVANGGVVMKPYLVDSVVSSTGHQIEKYSPQSSGSIMSASEAMQVKEMMEAVVNSGTATSLSGFGTKIAGKTGTAEVEGSGNNAWFIGFAPADNPKIALCVLVENADTSSSYTAVPIASQLFQYYLNR